MQYKSLWLDDVHFNRYDAISENKEVDVLIVGGGITGLSCAYHLRNSNLKICLVEQNLLAHGVTSRTTGKLTYLQDNIYSKLKSKALSYYKSQKYAIKLVKEIIKVENINCDYQEVESFLYTADAKEIKKIRKEEKMLQKLRTPYKKQKKLPIGIDSLYAISVNDTAVFHPLKYLNALTRIITESGVEIYENSSVTSIRKGMNKYMCRVNGHIISANKVIIASHYPYFLFPYLMPLKTHLEKSYVSASIIDELKKFSAISLSKPIKSIRYHNDCFIYSNKSHNLSTNYNYKSNFDDLIVELSKMSLKPEILWSNHDLMTEDNLPYIGYIGENLLIGTGYNTWGMTNGSLAGKIISDIILNKGNEFIDLFNPMRNKGIGIVKYPANMFYSIKSYIDSKISKNKSWYKDSVVFKKIGDTNIAIYIDEEKKEHIVYNQCPHLKCSLIFNESEKTWDCPCHGSRYNIDGKCLTGPSNKDITFRKNI